MTGADTAFSPLLASCSRQPLLAVAPVGCLGGGPRGAPVGARDGLAEHLQGAQRDTLVRLRRQVQAVARPGAGVGEARGGEPGAVPQPGEPRDARDARAEGEPPAARRAVGAGDRAEQEDGVEVDVRVEPRQRERLRAASLLPVEPRSAQKVINMAGGLTMIWPNVSATKYWPANLATYDDPHERVERARLDNDEDRAVMDGGVRGVDGDECAGGNSRVL